MYRSGLGQGVLNADTLFFSINNRTKLTSYIDSPNYNYNYNFYYTSNFIVSVTNSPKDLVILVFHCTLGYQLVPVRVKLNVLENTFPLHLFIPDDTVSVLSQDK